MRLTVKERKKAAAIIAVRYRKARKKEKGLILDEFTNLTGYGRRYASFVLRTHGKRTWINPQTVFVSDVRKRGMRKKERIYDDAVVALLKKAWEMMDFVCGKRLAPILKELIPRLMRFGEIRLTQEEKDKLMKISPATIYRILASERKKYKIKGRANTKPGTLLKSQIPIRTFSQWNDTKPGFVEIDLVGHDGGDGSGDFLQTLDVTDVATGWTETQAVKNKAQQWVFEALKDIRGRLPFPLLGIDSDNGSEFINHHLYKYCQEEKITFTRTRSYRKNDNCFVEQKNYSIVRRAVGYGRHHTPEEQAVLNDLYKELRLFTNFFQPSMKLLKKIREGSKVLKKYDKPLTPYRRILASPDVCEPDKAKLKALYRNLNPAALKRRITKYQQRLLRLSSSKQSVRKRCAA
jgi:IS30 family transposase